MRVGGQRHVPAAVSQRKTWHPLYRKLDGPQERSGRVSKTLPTPGFDPRTVQLVASRYTDWAIPLHNSVVSRDIKCVSCVYRAPFRYIPHCEELMSVLLRSTWFQKSKYNFTWSFLLLSNFNQKCNISTNSTKSSQNQRSVESGSSSHADPVVDGQRVVLKRIGYSLWSVRVYRTVLLLHVSDRRHGPQVVQKNCTSFGQKYKLVVRHTCDKQMFTLFDFGLPARSSWERRSSESLRSE